MVDLGGGRDSEQRPQAQYAVRYDKWKQLLLEQRAAGTLQSGPSRPPSNTYWDWLMDHAFLAVPTQAIVGEFLATFQEFPPRQKAASFTVDQDMDKLLAGIVRRRP